MFSEVMSLAVGFGVLAFLMWIANLAQKRRAAEEPYQGLAMLSYLTLAFFYGLAFVMGVIFQGFGALLSAQPQLLDQLGMTGNANPFANFGSFALVGLGLWLPSLLGVLLLLPPARRLLARFIPIDPGNPVHAVALALVALVGINLLVTLGFGLNNLATTLEQQGGAGSAATFVSLWAQQIFTALLAMIGVGWLSRRNLPSTLQRLGIVRPTVHQVAIAIGIALLLVPLVLLVEYASSQAGIGENADVQRLSEQLLGPLFHSPFGVFTVGAAAALGEETLLRGAAQPRFGLLLTAVIFALLHSNYGISLSTAVVFVLGLVLGVVRQRANTSTSMVIHAVYNSTLGLLAYLGG